MAYVKVRFAPSPTGFLHIGGVRTALFNYIFTRGQKGRFFLRIEDTDQERSRPEYEDQILSGLKWLGLDWDERPKHQMKRLRHYDKACEELVKKDLAYQDPKGSKALYFKVPKKKMKCFDLIHNTIEVDTNLFEDFVIRKSDGVPAFHFACVVDDAKMGITHVIRGDDHLTNTARQILLYEALGFKIPKFAHLPLILNENGKPLSKREGGGSLEFYIQGGFLPNGLLNYLALLGWGPQNNEEFFTLETLIEKFSLKRVNKNPAALNLEKMRHINGLHMKRIPQEDYSAYVRLFYKREVEDNFSIAEKDFVACALLYKDRAKTFRDVLEEGSYFFEEVLAWDPQTLKKYLAESFCEHLKHYMDQLKTLSDFSSLDALEIHLREQADKLGIRAADLIHPLRYILTGKTVSPGIFEVMQLLGKRRVVERLEAALTTQEEVAREG